MLTMLLKVLVIIVIAILMVISVLLRPELMHLLRTGSKLVWSATISAHGHCKVVSFIKTGDKLWINRTHSVQEIVEQIWEQRFRIAVLGSFLGPSHT
jgi:hypothetical protein